MITQLDPQLHMHTPKGPGWAHFVIDYGPESDLVWVVFMDADGACWSVPNPETRISFNWTLGRRRAEDRADVPTQPGAVPLRPIPARARPDAAGGA